MFAFRNCAVLSAALLLSLLSAAAQADDVEGQPIYIHNKTDRPIYVACRYLPAGTPDFPGRIAWATSGLWKVDSGQKRLIVYNKGRRIFLGAFDDKGHRWEGKDEHVVFAGAHRLHMDLIQYKTPDNFEPWTWTVAP